LIKICENETLVVPNDILVFIGYTYVVFTMKQDKFSNNAIADGRTYSNRNYYVWMKA